MSGWRRAESVRWMLALAVSAAVGCADDAADGDVNPADPTGSTSDGGAAKGSWCAAREVFQDACVACHAQEPVGGAPMSLATFADLQVEAPVTKGKKVYEVVKSRVHDEVRPMPPSRELSASELAAIDDWVAAGAKDDPTCNKAGEDDTPAAPWPPPGCDQIYQLRAGEAGQKAVIKAGSETHPQFYLDAPWGDEKVQAVAFRPITDNKKVLHHWIIYENAGVGAFITGWAPGQDDTKLKELPSNIGIYLPTGKQSLRLDMHYFNLQGTQDEQDASGVEVCVTRAPRPVVATTFQNFSALPLIPPGSDMDITGKCLVKLSEPVFLMNSSPHAHTLANWSKLVVQRGDQTITLHDKAFRFEEQTAIPFNPYFELKDGDMVTTTCHFKNDTSRYVTFSESTNGEMCFNFAMYYPMGALSCSGIGVFGL
jgi:mono/diheme cytochrome c family protein